MYFKSVKNQLNFVVVAFRLKRIKPLHRLHLGNRINKEDAIWDISSDSTLAGVKDMLMMRGLFGQHAKSMIASATRALNFQ